MRYLIILTCSLFFFACKKNDRIGETPGDSALSGKWKYTESYMSIGGPVIYTPAAPPFQFVSFNADGKIQSNMDFFKTITGYEVQDSVSVRFFTASNPLGYLHYGYIIDASKKLLTLYPRNPMCIEGCGMKFVK